MLTPGTRLGVFEITAQIGEGGMGAVYRATDTSLSRQVAIKVLPDAFAQDAERLARFEREAKTLAALNHPNISAIYAIEKSAGVTALVMELVEGDDLSQRIARGAIPIDEALPIAKQIADALEAAHEQGIIHRDLKPANIKVRSDGTVKVLDFGLAKAMEPVGSAPNVSQSPTITTPAMMTSLGVILGTAAYMSPEQARGRAVDKRTDIWAFGCVLYEMLAARRAFPGEAVQDTLAKVLEREPDWKALPVSTPTKIRHLLLRCLQKDQSLRPNRIAEVRTAIAEARTSPSARRRVTTSLIAIAGVALALAVVTGVWWYSRTSIQLDPHEAVSVLIADVENRTNEPMFDHALETVFKLALEGATFINAYNRSGMAPLGVTPPEKLDEAAAREIALKQGVGVILSGAVERQGNGYVISVKAVESVTGKEITTARSKASDKDQVLGVATRLVIGVRRALGDKTSDSAQLFAMTSLSATSLDVVRYYAASREAASNGKFEESRQNALKAVELDPTFGIGYQLLAVSSRNLGNVQDAEQFIGQALRHLDGMTERERYATRGFFFRLSGDYHQCVKEYGQLIARYPADVAAHNQRALCSSYLRDLRTAITEMRRVVEILPNRPLYRGNLAVYADYASDFQTGEKEARAVRQPDVYPLLALAFAQIGQGQVAEAANTYQALGRVNALGVAFSVSGLADLAVYEGRFADAVAILEHGASAELAVKSADRAATKLASLADVQRLRGQKAAAMAAAESALAISKAVKIRFMAARTFVEIGELPRARVLMTALASEVQAEPRAYAKIIEGQVALNNGKSLDAVNAIGEANRLFDTWIGHFELGRAYLVARQLPQADSEFDACLKRRGEALSLFLDEWPTYAFLPPVYYFQARVREELKTDRFADGYKQYLSIRGKSTEDSLVPEVRRRVRVEH